MSVSRPSRARITAQSRAQSSRVRWGPLLVQLSVVGLILAAWQFAPVAWLDDSLVSRPTLIARQTWQWLVQGLLFTEAAHTLLAVCTGLLAGGVVGTVAGLAAASTALARNLVEPWVKFLFSLPKIAFVPLFIVWFGVGPKEEALFVAFVGFFFFFYASYNGTRQIPPAWNNLLSIAGSSRLQRIRLLYLPASMGWWLAGLRMAVPYAFVSATSIEIVSSRHGLGNLVKTSASVLDPAGMFAAMSMLLVVSVGLSIAMLRLGERSRWNV